MILRISVSVFVVSLNPGVSYRTISRPSNSKGSATSTLLVHDVIEWPTVSLFVRVARLIN